jgi:hypothetical protein
MIVDHAQGDLGLLGNIRQGRARHSLLIEPGFGHLNQAVALEHGRH